jgi:hypothetical protein
MSDETALATIGPETALSFFSEGQGVELLVEAVRNRALELMPADLDLTTAKGRAELVSVAYKVARTKSAIDDVGKALVAEYKAIPARIDATRKRLRDELDNLKAEIRKPVTEWEEKEAGRVQAIKDRIDGIRAHSGARAESSEEIMDLLKGVQALQIDDSFEELQGEAALAKDAVLSRLFERHAAAVGREAEEKERVEKMRVEQEARAKIEAEKKAALEISEAEKREAQALLAKEKAEREAAQAKADSEKKALEAVEAEKRRVALEEAKKKAEEEARTKDAERRFQVHSEILEDLKAVESVTPFLILEAIRDGRVRHLKIEY